ncbi:MAG: hemerythrin family protein [Magnetococcales bacterium]|nr:hemerythrin family protein [Magnetococcales bacterium]
MAAPQDPSPNEAFRARLSRELRDVGVSAFNQDHRSMLGAILNFHELVENLSRRRPSNTDWRQVDDAMEHLSTYASTHFKAEESLMSLHGFPGLEEHRREHEAFVQRLAVFRQEVRTRNILVTVDVKFFLLEWLFTHINQMDYKYADFFRRKGVS